MAGVYINFNRKGVSYFFLLMVYLIMSEWMVPVSMAQQNSVEEQNNSDQKLELNFEVVKSEYEYQIENRPDPFVPFFTGETTNEPTVNPDEIIETKEKLTGMQLFEPGQLTLVALLKTQERYVAMVEDFTGRGYVIKEGMKIGRRGVVKDIMPNKVLIEEVAMTRAGKELRNEIVMALRKEGEE